jgi:hypothetical protein
LVYNLHDRKRSTYFEQMDKFLEVQKYDRVIVKLEDYTDDLYAYNDYGFKLLIQSRSDLSNLPSEYIAYKKHLVSVCEPRLCKQIEH